MCRFFAVLKVILLGFAIAASAMTAACAQFTLSPLRQIVTHESPRVFYEISNPSQRTIDIQISWIDLQALETGYKRAEPNLRRQLSAAPYLIVSPNFLTLEPGARETITVQLRGGAQLPDGERRSHLLIESDAKRTLLRKAGGVQLDLGAGVSTPVFVRSGNDRARAKITDAQLLRRPDGLLELETVIAPKSDVSAFGSLIVDFTVSGASVATELSRIANVTAFAEANQRLFTVPLELKRLKTGILSIRFEGAGEFEGIIFDERSFNIEPAK